MMGLGILRLMNNRGEGLKVISFWQLMSMKEERVKKKTLIHKQDEAARIKEE